MRKRTISSITVATALLVACTGRVADEGKAPASDAASVLRNAEPGSAPAADQQVDGAAISAGDPGPPDAAGVMVTVDAAVALSPSSPDGAGPCTSLSIVDPGNSTQPAGPCLCTRRDANPAGTCPKGVGQSASATIGPEGGTLTLMGQQGAASGVPFTLTIPPTALSTPTAVTVTELSTPPPGGFVDWSPVYRIDPVDAILTTPASLDIPISNGRGTSAADQSMSIFWSGPQTCTLQRLPSSYTNAGFAQGSTTRFGYTIVGYVHAGNATYCL
jgi:hypothetical protein